jgi:hypothetical protein
MPTPNPAVTSTLHQLVDCINSAHAVTQVLLERMPYHHDQADACNYASNLTMALENLLACAKTWAQTLETAQR